MNTHHEYTALYGFLLIALCVFVRYRIGKRRFDRRGVAGLQQFSSYQKYIAVTTIERLLIFAANLCGLAGLGLLAINHLKF